MSTQTDSLVGVPVPISADPDKDCGTFTYQGKTQFGESWTFRPAQKVVDAGKQRLAVLDELMSYIPSQGELEGREDYPRLSADQIGSVFPWRKDHMRRPVWSLDGETFFFRRYNDDHNSCVMRGKLRGNWVAWDAGDISYSEIERQLATFKA